MSVELNKPASLAEQAAQWLGILLDAPDRKPEFFAWLGESPRNVEEFLFVLADAQDLAAISSTQRARLEEMSDALDTRKNALSNILPVSSSALAHCERATGICVDPMHHAAAERQPANTSPDIRRGTPNPRLAEGARESAARRLTLGWGATLSMACVVAVAAVWWLLEAPRWEVYATRVGEQRSLALADGSVVHLNTDSSVAVRLTDTSRTVRLVRGQALFSVERDPARPFRVHSAGAMIQAIGTQFDVYRTRTATHVAVIEGLVQVSGSTQSGRRSPIALDGPTVVSPGGDVPAVTADGASVSVPTLIAAGEGAEISARGAVSRHVAFDTAKVLAWRERRLVFEEETLAEIAAEFNRYNVNVKIRVLGRAADEERFSGTFDANAPEALTQVLASDPVFHVERSGEDIIIRAR